MGRGKELAKNTGIIAIGRISTRFISFFLLPLYTSVLSTSEYGIVDFFNTIVRLLLPVVTLMVGQGAFRYLVESKDEKEKTNIVSSATLLIMMLLTISGVLFYGVTIVWNNEYEKYLFWVLVSAAISDFLLQLARGFRKLSLYAVGGVVSSIIQISLNVVFLTVLKMGPIGMFLATIIGNFSCFLVLSIKLQVYKYIKLSCWNKYTLKDMLRYSVPLIPNQLSIWLLNSSDRFIVNLFLTASANGILAVSHKFPEVLSTFFNIFQISWHEMGTVHYNDPDRDQYYTETFHQVFRVLSSLCILLIAFLPLVFEWMIDVEYRDAYYTIPIYVFATMFNMMVGFLGAIYVAIKKTSEIAKTTIFVGIINVVLHILLIEFIGLYAAAISTLVSYFVVMVYRIIDTRKYISIRYDKKVIGFIFSMMVLVSVGYYIDILLVRLSVIILALLFVGFFNKKIFLQILGEVKRRIRKQK